MSFTVDDFQDLLRLLAERPEWRAELRRHVLPDELLELPAIVRRLAEAQERTEQQLASLGARVDQLASRMDELAEAQVRTDQQLLVLIGRIDQLVARFDQHERRNAIDFQVLKNESIARRLAERPGMFRPILRDPRPLTPAEADTFLSGLLDRELIVPAEFRELAWTDLLVRGEREGQTGYLVTEVSWTVGPKDVARAQRRTSLLRRIGIPAWPGVVAHRVSDRARDLLQQEPVVHVVPGPDGDEIEDEEPD